MNKCPGRRCAQSWKRGQETNNNGVIDVKPTKEVNPTVERGSGTLRKKDHPCPSETEIRKNRPEGGLGG